MRKLSKAGLGMLVVIASSVGLGQVASARSIIALATDQDPNTPSGTTYGGCGSNPRSIWAQATGWRADGSIACLARSFNNGVTSQGSCDSPGSPPPTHFQSTVRYIGSIFCFGADNPWFGTISACHARIFGQTSASSTCGTFDLGVWGRGQ